jgi:hypothetical protein
VGGAKGPRGGAESVFGKGKGATEQAGLLSGRVPAVSNRQIGEAPTEAATLKVYDLRSIFESAD